ncbi:MAG: VOC family protein [Actinomycetota bacterium]|nr:VOC family protein [Actinomycetota bacterium]
MSSSVVWFELPAADTDRARDFYARLFGWSFEAFGDEDYHVSYEAGGAVSGAPDEKGLLAYFGVDDIDAAIARVRELGGEAGGKQVEPGVGEYAHCNDPEGNRFGLFRPEASA